MMNIIYNAAEIPLKNLKNTSMFIGRVKKISINSPQLTYMTPEKVRFIGPGNIPTIPKVNRFKWQRIYRCIAALRFLNKNSQPLYS